MNKILVLVIFVHYLLAFQSCLVDSINWQTGGWAFACDFTNNDLKNAKTISSQCGPTWYAFYGFRLIVD